MRFAFDAELLKHKAYQSTIRALMRRARLNETSKKVADPSDPAELVAQLEAEHQTATSRQLDRFIREENSSRRGILQILLLGLPGSGMAAVRRRLVASFPTETEDQPGQVLSEPDIRMQYRVPIIDFTIRSLQAAMKAMIIVHETNCDKEYHRLNTYVELLRNVTEYVSSRILPLHVSAAAITLCNSRVVRKYLGHALAKVTNPPVAS